MSNLIRRANTGDLGRDLRVGLGWDPFQAMREMLQWEPFREESSLPQALRQGYTPSFDIRESKEAFHFHADLPGLKQEDLEITLNGNLLTIAGRREKELREDTKRSETERYHTSERWYGSFARTFALPEGIDQGGVVAELKEGVLRVIVPKRPEVQPRKIAISIGSDNASGDKKASA